MTIGPQTGCMLPVYSAVIADTMKRALTGARATDPTVSEPRRRSRRRARTRVEATGTRVATTGASPARAGTTAHETS
jgi:hypothetical protein